MFSNLSDCIVVLLLLLGISTLVSLVLTRVMLYLLPKLGMVDKPDFKRHIHKVPIPRGGGIGIAISFLAIICIFTALFPVPNDEVKLAVHFLLPLGILLPLGVLDDKFSLKAGVKFVFQIAAAALAWYLGIRITYIFGLELPVWGSCMVTVFWIVALINAFNMIDGVDGLAGGIGCISALSMIFIAATQGYQGTVSFLIIFVGSLLGFLYFNWHPAKIFMGDTGSMFIGYILAVMGIGLNARLLSVASIGVPLLACGVPVLDILLAVWRRVFNPEAIKALENGTADGMTGQLPRVSMRKHIIALLKRLGTADRSHLHHRLLNYFHNNQQQTVRRIYGLAIAMGVMAIICALIPGQSMLLAMTLIIGTFSLVISRLATLELWNSAETLFSNFHSARTGLILSHAVHPLYDLVIITLATFFTNRGTILAMPIYLVEHVTVLMLVLIISRNYRTFWNYSVSDDYFRLLATLVGGYYLSWLVKYFVFNITPGERFVAGAGIAITFILGERLLLHFCRNFIIARRNNSSLSQDETVVSTLIYGITPIARYYRDQLSADLCKSGRERILGLLAEDRMYIHSFCYGMKVLGIQQDMEVLYKEKPFQKLVLAKQPSPVELSKIVCFCQERSIQLRVIQVIDCVTEV